MDLYIATEFMSGETLPYSTDLNAAWKVWLKINERFQLLLASNRDRTEILRVFETKMPEVIASSESGAHAICLAAEALLAH